MFLDEAGNLDFSANGTRYFLLSSVTRERPFKACKELIELKYDFVELGMNIEYFHAAEDTQAVRNRVFEIIGRDLEGVRIDTLIVEKSNVMPEHRTEDQFYPRMLGFLLRFVLRHYSLKDYREVIVFTDRLPMQRKRAANEKAVKVVLARRLAHLSRYRVLHHDSKSNQDLQIADYCNWAVYRKWSLEIYAPTVSFKQPSGANSMSSRLPPASLRNKSDHPGYSCERAPWALITGVEPLNYYYKPEIML
jgi:hypothetical protein